MGGIIEKRVHDIALLIDSGITQRRKKGPTNKRTFYRIIRARDIEDGMIAPLGSLDKLQDTLTPKGEKKELKANDVLVATKGVELKAVKVTNAYEGCFFADTLTRIRLKESVVPEYLVLLFSLPFIIKKLTLHSSGYTAFIPKKELEELSIPVPDIDTQLSLVKVYSLFEKEKELTTKLLDLKQQFVTQAITKIIKEV